MKIDQWINKRNLAGLTSFRDYPPPSSLSPETKFRFDTTSSDTKIFGEFWKINSRCCGCNCRRDEFKNYLKMFFFKGRVLVFYTKFYFKKSCVMLIQWIRNLSSLSNFFLCGGWLICFVEGNQGKEFGSLLSSLHATLIQYATYWLSEKIQTKFLLRKSPLPF